MRWATVAHKDFHESRDSRLTKWLLWLFAIVVLASAYVFPIGQQSATTTDFAVSITGRIALVLSLVGLLLGYATIVGERRRGQLRLLLALPHARRDVVLGKYVGRAAVMAITVVASLALAGWLVVYPFGTLELAPYVAFAVVTVLFGCAFLGIGMAVSTALSTERRATAAAFAIFFVLVLIWDRLPAVAAFVLAHVGLHEGPLPNWTLFLHGLEPVGLYDRLVAGFIGETTFEPWYMNEWVALVAFIGWLIVPLWFGLRRFEGGDL